jgi:serine protease Do
MKSLLRKASMVLILVFVLSATKLLKSSQKGKSNIGYCTVTDTGFYSDKQCVEKIQERISKIYDKLLNSVVRVNMGSYSASAVIISKDGYILTAAHVIDAVGGKEAEIRLHNGSTYMAKCLGKNKSADYGLMKIESKEKLVFSEMGTASDLAKDETCLMFGHPASIEKERPAIARIGFYKGINDKGYLKTSCIMMPGDSGGPLFNLNGQVVGICSNIRVALDENYYPSVDNVKRNWSKLIKGEFLSAEEINYNTGINEAPEKEAPFVLKGGKETLAKVLSEKQFQNHKSVVAIESQINGMSSNTKGTVIDSEGYIVAKSSQIGDKGLYVMLLDKSKVKAKIIGRDKENDLAVLKVKTKLKPISLKIVKGDATGQILATVTDSAYIKYSGILGLESRKIIGREIGFLGIEYAIKGELYIKRTLTGGPAQKAGLLAGDEIVAFNDKAILKRSDFRKALSKTKPNQEVNITVLRNRQKKNIDVVLGSRASNGHKHHPADYTEVSKVKSGFPYAFTHDMPLELNECGTPVINLSGEVIGINIARKNRASSLAIPLMQIQSIVKKILEASESNM